MAVIKVDIAGNTIQNYRKLIINKSSGDVNISSKFEMFLDSPYSRHASDFTINDAITVYAEETTILDTQPYLHYRMNDNAASTTVTDSGSGANNGTATANTDTLSEAGKINAALRFDSEYINTGDVAGLEFGAGDFTILAWVKSDDPSDGGVIVEKAATPGELEYQFTVASGTLLIQMSSDGNTFNYKATGGEINTDWNHVAFVKSGTNLTVYVNGKKVTLFEPLGSPPATLNTSAADFLVGDSSGGFGELEGLIDDLRIYQSALTATEVAGIYENGAGTEDQTSSRIFNGIIEKIDFEGIGTNQKLTLTGRDFNAYLFDTTIEPITYTGTEISAIVKDLIANNTSLITTVNRVDNTGVNIPRITFNQLTLFSAIEQLAEIAGYYFFVDHNQELVFKPKTVKSSGVTLDNTQILQMSSIETKEGMSNLVWVYGSKQLVGQKEIFNSNGSTFTLLHNPHNTRVESSAFPGSLLKGGVEQFSPTIVSGLDYLVNFYDKQITFLSGTEIGYTTIPPVGGSIIINYEQERPIAKFGANRNSIQAFGPKTLIINDKSINDPRTATTLINDQLKRNSEPQSKNQMRVNGWYNLEVGETIKVTLTDFNLNLQELPILNIKYVFDKNTIESNNILEITVDKRITDIVDSFTTINDRLNRLEAFDTQLTDTLTKIEFAVGSVLVVGSTYNIYERWNGSGFMLGGENRARSSGLTTGPYLGRLGSFTTGSASFLGTAGVTDYELNTTGGYIY